MNPCIPVEFYSSTQFVTSDWEVDVEHSDDHIQYPHVPDGAYSRLKVLPLQVLLLQQILEDPSLLGDAELPKHTQEFLLSHLMRTGRLTAHTMAALLPNAETLDFSFLPAFESTLWLAKLTACTSLTALHLLHVVVNIPDLSFVNECASLQELSIGTLFGSTEVNTEALGPVFARLKTFRLRTPITFSDERLAPSLLALCSPSSLEHLELDLLGTQPIPWTPHIVAFQNLRVLRVNRPNKATLEDIAHLTTNIYKFPRLEEAFINYDNQEAMKQFVSTGRIFALPKLKKLFVNDYIGWNKYSELRSPLSNKIEVYNTPHKWRSFPIDLTPSEFASKLINPSQEDVDDWVRNLRYANENVTLIEHIFSTLVSEGPTPFSSELIAHPLFIPLVAQLMRTHAKNSVIWLTLAPVICTIFSDLTSLSSMDSSSSDNAFLTSAVAVAMKQLIFENLRPILEEAVAAHAINFDGVSPDPAHESDFLLYASASHQPARDFAYATHFQLLRFICLVARFPSRADYASRLCLSHSASIAAYVAQPWHKFYSSANLFHRKLLPLLGNIEENPDFCYKMHENGLHDTVEQVMDRWCPQTQWSEPKMDSESTQSFLPLTALFGTLLPKHVHHLLKHRPKLVEKLIRMLPYDSYGEWIFPLSVITSSHALYSPHEVVCKQLPIYTLWSYRAHNGDLGAHIMVFSGSFCNFCRANYVSGLPPNLLESARDNGIPTNAFEFMSKRMTADPVNFWKPVASWVLESDSVSSTWLLRLRDAFISHQMQNQGAGAVGAYAVQQTAEEFFTRLCETGWSQSIHALAKTRAYARSLPWETSQLWESMSIFSQSPPFCDLIWNHQNTSFFDFVCALIFKLGFPSYSLSLMYHVSCYRGEEFVKELEKKRVKVIRDPNGSRRIDASHSYPCRLFSPLHLDQTTQQEDALSAITETLLAGIFSLPRSHLFITLRILANISFYHPQMHDIMKQKSRYVPKLLAHAIANTENDGEVIGVQLVVCEIFGNLDHTARNSLPVPLKQILTQEAMLHYIKVAEKCGQPWWESCESFLLRSIFKRGLHLILGDIKQEKLSQSQIETITYLVDATVRLAKLQDITTQEAAFQALIEALTIPDSSSMSVFEYSLKNLTREVVVKVLKDKYEQQWLVDRISFQHFGYESKVKMVGILLNK